MLNRTSDRGPEIYRAMSSPKAREIIREGRGEPAPFKSPSVLEQFIPFVNLFLENGFLHTVVSTSGHFG